MVGNELVDGIVGAGVVSAGGIRCYLCTVLADGLQYVLPVGHDVILVHFRCRDIPFPLEHVIGFSEYRIVEQAVTRMTYTELYVIVIPITGHAVRPRCGFQQKGEDAQIVSGGYQTGNGGGTWLDDMVDDVHIAVVSLYVFPGQSALVVDAYGSSFTEVTAFEIEMQSVDSGIRQVAAGNISGFPGVFLSHVDDARVHYLPYKCLGKGVQPIVVLTVIVVQIVSDGLVGRNEDGKMSIDAQQTADCGL